MSLGDLKCPQGGELLTQENQGLKGMDTTGFQRGDGNADRVEVSVCIIYENVVC